MPPRSHAASISLSVCLSVRLNVSLRVTVEMRRRKRFALLGNRHAVSDPKSRDVTSQVKTGAPVSRLAISRKQSSIVTSGKAVHGIDSGCTCVPLKMCGRVFQQLENNVRVVQHASIYHTETTFATWLLTIVRYHCICLRTDFMDIRTGLRFFLRFSFFSIIVIPFFFSFSISGFLSLP